MEEEGQAYQSILQMMDSADAAVCFEAPSDDFLEPFSTLVGEISGEFNLRKLKAKITSCLAKLVPQADKIAFYFVRTKTFDKEYEKFYYATSVLTEEHVAEQQSKEEQPEESKKSDSSSRSQSASSSQSSFDVGADISSSTATEYFNTMLNDMMPQQYKAILNYVIETGEPVYLSDSSKLTSKLFDILPEQAESLDIKSILAMGCRDKQKVTQGVVKFKSFSSSAFDNTDVKLLGFFLNHCGEAISMAKKFTLSLFENQRRKILIDTMPTLFDSDKSLEDILYQMMDQSKRLFDSSRCSIYLQYKHENGDCLAGLNYVKTEQTREALNKIYDLVETGNCLVVRNRLYGQNDVEDRIVEQVLNSGNKITIPDAFKNRSNIINEEEASMSTQEVKSVMCVPLCDSQRNTIGCIRMTRSIDHEYNYDKHDESLFEEFCQLYGISIGEKLMRREFELTRLDIELKSEMLTYHVKPDSKLVDWYLSSLPGQIDTDSRVFQRSFLSAYMFDDFCLTDDQMVFASYKIMDYSGLISSFEIDENTFINWILTVRKSYRPVHYHNWRHAFNCCQSMFAIFENSIASEYLSKELKLGLLIACLCHDLDHRGTSNRFQEETQSLLSQLYGTKSTMEQHHLKMFYEILNMTGNNILCNLDSQTYKTVMNYATEAILATDLVNYFSIRKYFEQLVYKSEIQGVDWTSDNSNVLLRRNLMTFCDLASVAKPWNVHYKVVNCVLKEFFSQGQFEKDELNIEPLPIMDPSKAQDIPKFQIGWIDNVCLPLLNCLSKICPSFEEPMSRVRFNRKMWAKCYSGSIE